MRRNRAVQEWNGPTWASPRTAQPLDAFFFRRSDHRQRGRTKSDSDNRRPQGLSDRLQRAEAAPRLPAVLAVEREEIVHHRGEVGDAAGRGADVSGAVYGRNGDVVRPSIRQARDGVPTGGRRGDR